MMDSTLRETVQNERSWGTEGGGISIIREVCKILHQLSPVIRMNPFKQKCTTTFDVTQIYTIFLYELYYATHYSCLEGKLL